MPIDLRFIRFALFTLGAMLSLRAQDNNCKECQQVLQGGVFNEKSLHKTAASASSFNSWLCTTEFQSHDEAHSSGIDFGIPVYDVPIKVGGKFDSSQRDNWKKSHCSAKSGSNQSFAALAVALREADPAILQAWTRCIAIACPPTTSALSCGTTPVQGGAVFQARWNRNTGDNKTPVVRYFGAYDAKCDRAIKKGENVTEAPTALFCTIPNNAEAVFILETDRGTCTLNALGRESQLTFAGKTVLTKPEHFKADRIVFKSDAVLVTNGNHLQIEALEIQLEGAPQILSFEQTDKPQGRKAAPIILKTERLLGTSLTILNAGEDGAPGAAGAEGAVGPGGSQGNSMYWNLGGCQNGTNGSTGGKGGPGAQGGTGQSGGNGGTVMYDIASGLQSGPIKRLIISAPGGTGGVGGTGGPGGKGGPGGPGAPGGPGGCGGTGPGYQGPTGDPGGTGHNGLNGIKGDIVNARA
jgi:hypothetical protein